MNYAIEDLTFILVTRMNDTLSFAQKTKKGVRFVGCFCIFFNVWIFFSFTSYYHKTENACAHNKKRYGKIRSPYWSPGVGWTKPLSLPLIMKEKEILVIIL